MLDKANPHNLTMEENLERMLQAQPTLDPRLFDLETNLLLPRARAHFLTATNLIINNCIKPFPFFAIKGAVICGSADSYYYHEYSDIDLKILVEQKKGEYHFPYDLQAKNFLNSYKNAFLQKGYKLHFDGRAIEFSIDFYFKNPQIYSLFDNRWLKEPSKSWLVGVNKEKIMQRTKAIAQQIDDFKKLKNERAFGKYESADVFEMQTLYNAVVKMKMESFEGMLINKLLVYSGILPEFQKFYHQELSEIYTL